MRRQLWETIWWKIEIKEESNIRMDHIMMEMSSMDFETELDNIVMTIRFGMGVGSMTNKMDILTITKMDI